MAANTVRYMKQAGVIARRPSTALYGSKGSVKGERRRLKHIAYPDEEDLEQAVSDHSQIQVTKESETESVGWL